MYQYYLFDFDYTLVNSEAGIVGSLDHPRARIALLYARQAVGGWLKRPCPAAEKP